MQLADSLTKIDRGLMLTLASMLGDAFVQLADGTTSSTVIAKEIYTSLVGDCENWFAGQCPVLPRDPSSIGGEPTHRGRTLPMRASKVSQSIQGSPS